MRRTAFIGAGHIVNILADNITSKYKIDASLLGFSDPDEAKLEETARRFRGRAFASNGEALEWCEAAFVCVPPHAAESVIDVMRSVDMRGKAIISVCAGVKMERYRDAAKGAHVARILPNPPSRLGEGAVPVAFDGDMPSELREDVLAMVSSLGPCFSVAEDKIDIFTSLTSPAPMFALFDAMIDAALYLGLDHKTSSAMVRQTVRGCLAMWENAPDAPISSFVVEASTPGGTSVESLRALDRGAFRSVVKESYIAACEKSRALGKR